MQTPNLTPLPNLLQQEVSQAWEDFQNKITPEQLTTLEQHTDILQSLPKVWAGSPFITKNCVQYPDLLVSLAETGDLLNNNIDYPSLLKKQLAQVEDEATFHQVLRQFRRREMTRIAWRDITKWSDLNESLHHLSTLADALIDGAYHYLYEKLTKQFGTPRDEQGNAQSMIILGMGKLGGQELNFSSDIDLIFAYPDVGETDGERRTRTNQEFFVRLGQQLIQALDNITVDGFVYRVDMRLRPFGDSGPLAMHFMAMEDYYQVHARDWERYALVKARVCAGDKEQGQILLDSLRPFIYRRYLDYNAFEALRNMKGMIDQEARRKGLENNIKLGKGGIREVEFICQVFQLIRGGRQPALQERHVLKVLRLLEQYELLFPNEVNTLRNAYQFLRLSENHLQAIEDKQTQTLPDDTRNQTRLAYIMGFEDWDSFLSVLQRHQNAVHEQFKVIIAPVEETEETSQEKDKLARWRDLWVDNLQAYEHNQPTLDEAGFQDSHVILEHLTRLKNAYSIGKMSTRGRERLDELIPLLFETAVKYKHRDVAIHRSLDFIEAIAQRSVYISLLVEKPQVLKQLIRLFANSEWLAEQITRYPLLLDELLDTRRLYNPLNPVELGNALQAQLAHLPNDDLEMQMDSLRQFKRAYVLHVAASETTGHLTVEVVSDYLTSLADTLVQRALSIAWDYLTQKHGQPCYEIDGETYQAGFCVIAYGKAGGIELSYSSDLDIVFLHDSHGESQMTNGNKPLDNGVFFARLAQRIINILTITTPAGILYEVDSRLRPGGSSGLLVSSFETFKNYEEKEAWTWEHQALVRARAIAGDNNCRMMFENIRRDILQLDREPEKLAEDVSEMRVKMRDSLDKSNSEIFDIKQGVGGIADIEFIVQYVVLRHAKDFSSLLDTTGMLPMLRLCAEFGLLDEMACDQLAEAYRRYRAETHRLTLQKHSAQVPQSVFTTHREHVQQWWNNILGF